MRIARKLAIDQENIKRFLDVLGNAMIVLNNNELAHPGFFVTAHSFIQGYIEGWFFKKEEIIIRALEDSGFPPETGPIAAIRTDQESSRKASEKLIEAAKRWKTGDDSARQDVGWAASEFSVAMRKHLERLKNLTFPLIEQNIPLEEEHALSAKFDTIVPEGAEEKIDKLLKSLEDELSDWR